MAELPQLGRHCGLSDCGQLDFLPLVCAHCAETFCRLHLPADAHCCAKVPEAAKADLTARPRAYGCHVAGCDAAELAPVTCASCQLPCCLAHRLQPDHGCAEWQARQAEAARRLPQAQRADELQAARLAAPPTVGLGRPAGSERARRTAATVQLMRLKQRAAGDGAVPLADRLYLLAVAPGGRGRALPAFVSRRWTVGRAVDALAELCAVRNENDRAGGRRLLLYRRADGGRVGDAMDDVIEQLPAGQLNNGETVVLEYGDPTQAQRDDVTQYDLT